MKDIYIKRQKDLLDSLNGSLYMFCDKNGLIVKEKILSELKTMDFQKTHHSLFKDIEDLFQINEAIKEKDFINFLDFKFNQTLFNEENIYKNIISDFFHNKTYINYNDLYDLFNTYLNLHIEKEYIKRLCLEYGKEKFSINDVYDLIVLNNK